MDGLGNLSEQALIAWADYLLDTCLDPSPLQASLLDFEAIKTRIEACLVFEAPCANKACAKRPNAACTNCF